MNCSVSSPLLVRDFPTVLSFKDVYFEVFLVLIHPSYWICSEMLFLKIRNSVLSISRD